MLSIIKRSAEPKDLAIEERTATEPSPDELLIRVKATGICGSDLHMYAGHGGYDWINYPLVLGHEITGVVTTSRAGGYDNLVGERVVVNPYKPCGRCEYCRRGEENRCDAGHFHVDKRPPASLRLGFREDGGMREYLSVPPENVIPVDDSVSDEVAAISEAIAVGLEAVKKVDRLGEKAVVVFGPGPIGLAICALLTGFGVRKVAIVGVPGDEDRLEKARVLGVDTAIIRDDRLTAHLTALASGYDAAFDCSGHPSVPPDALKLLKKGGQLILVGISDKGFTLPMDQVVRGEIRIEGSYGITHTTLEETLRIAVDPAFHFSELIAARYPARQANDAFETAMAGPSGRIVLEFNNSNREKV